MQEQQHDPAQVSGSKRGFASMDSERQREVARAGGKAAHKRGTAHEFASDEARAAGQKGGLVISRDRAHMAQIGRLGGITRGKRLRAGQSPSQGAPSGRAPESISDAPPLAPKPGG